MRKVFSCIVISCFGLALVNCSNKPATNEETTFTKQDSLTDTYLAYQDSMLQAWNIMIHDDNQKIKKMHSLLHELMVSNPDQQEEFSKFEERLEQLRQLRYTQKSMANADVVEEYDFASSSLVSELLSLTESQPEFAYNSTLQALAEEIQLADQRVNNYRNDYDLIVMSYNRFLEKNENYLKALDQTDPQKKPLFQMVSE
ncbi:MAG TPA: LemA family protein [Ohtaekwangia sp.]|nr:LemA family protein [Ohtaekwangia sp.]